MEEIYQIVEPWGSFSAYGGIMLGSCFIVLTVRGFKLYRQTKDIGYMGYNILWIILSVISFGWVGFYLYLLKTVG